MSDPVIHRTEVVAPEPAHALAGLLDVPVPDLEKDGLPATWHWLYLLDRPAQADLGQDGHPTRATIPAPPGPGYRRMWAGGHVRTLAPLRCGERATRSTHVLESADKTGRSGALTIVKVQHQIEQLGQVVVEERQDIVYREALTTSAHAVSPPVPPPAAPVVEGDWEIDTTPTLLFRFSAVTYNAHRIHYDRDYARDVEGYPGLLTHGPLQALAMAEAERARRAAPRWEPTVFDYRLSSPLFDYQGMVVQCSIEAEMATTRVTDRAGRPTAAGTITHP